MFDRRGYEKAIKAQVSEEELYDNFISTAITKFKAEYGIEPDIIPVVINDVARKL